MVLDLPCADVGRSADLLSHEATFTADMYVKARVAQHSTAPMAGNFARQLGAETLVLTHFSGRFTDFRGKVRLPSMLLARSIVLTLPQWLTCKECCLGSKYSCPDAASRRASKDVAGAGMAGFSNDCTLACCAYYAFQSRRF